MIPESIRTCVPNLVAVRRLCRKRGVQTRTHARTHARTKGHCNFIIIIVDVFYQKLIGGHYCLLGWSLLSQNEWILAIFLTSECTLYFAKWNILKYFLKKRWSLIPPISSHRSDTPSTAESKQRTHQSHTLPVWNELFQLHRPNTCKRGLCTDSFKLNAIVQTNLSHACTRNCAKPALVNR